MSVADAIGHRTAPLGYVAKILPSGVDKKTIDGERPVRLCNYTDIYYRDRITADLDFMPATATDAEIERFTLRPGDVVMTKDSETADDIAIPALVSEELDGVVLGYHNALIRPDTTKVDPRFLFWTLMGRQSAGFFETKARGVTRVGLRADDMASLPVPVPSLEVQRRVADMLDAETARIDTLITKNHQVRALLRLRWQALLERRLFGDQDAPRTPLWLVCDITPGYAYPSAEFLHEHGPVRLLRGINVGVGRLNWDEIVYATHEVVDQAADFRLQAGDIVLGMDRPWISSGLRVARVNEDDLPAALVQRVARLRPRSGLDPEYLYLALQSRRFFSAFEPSMTGVSVPHVSGGQIGDFALPLPGPSDQRAVADRLVEELGQIDALTRRVQRQVDLLRTRRQALITAAVTGQITA